MKRCADQGERRYFFAGSISSHISRSGQPARTQSRISSVRQNRDLPRRTASGTSVIVTTNLPFEQWTEVLGSQRLTGAVLDRLTHHCHILEATGDSYRLKDARRRSGNDRPRQHLDRHAISTILMTRPPGGRLISSHGSQPLLYWKHNPTQLCTIRPLSLRCNLTGVEP